MLGAQGALAFRAYSRSLMLPDRSFASCATFEGTDTRVRIGFWVEGRLGVGNLLEKPFLSCLARCVGGCVCVCVCLCVCLCAHGGLLRAI